MMGLMSDAPLRFHKPILGHGYLTLVDCWGRESIESAVGDEAIIAAARMSTGKGFLGWGELRCSCGTSSVLGKLPHTHCTMLIRLAPITT
jgi:hypothetical protein